jgi:hypothetical protein
MYYDGCKDATGCKVGDNCRVITLALDKAKLASVRNLSARHAINWYQANSECLADARYGEYLDNYAPHYIRWPETFSKENSVCADCRAT